jgi:peptidyl-tRNA hydrolase
MLLVDGFEHLKCEASHRRGRVSQICQAQAHNLSESEDVFVVDDDIAQDFGEGLAARGGFVGNHNGSP